MQKIRKTLLAAVMVIVCTVCCLPTVVNAAEPELENPTAGVLVELYDSSKGLATSEANDIIQTHDGFIYVGCYSGLFRYDGSNFTRFGSDANVKSTVDLYEDSKGKLWIGTNDSGVACYDDGEFLFYTTKDGLHSNVIRSIVEDAKGNILIATASGLNYINKKNEVKDLSAEHLDDDFVEELSVSGTSIYGKTSEGSIFSIQDLKEASYYTADDLGYPVNTVYPDPDDAGWLYIGTADGRLIHTNYEKGLTNSVETDASLIGQIDRIRRNGSYLWVMGGNGVGFIGQDHTIQMVKDAPLNNSVKNMIQDYEGNFWFTSTRQGVMKIVSNIFTDVSKLAGLDKMVVNSTCYSKGYLYVGTDNGLIVLDQDMNQVNNEVTAYLEECRIRSIKKDSRGNLWFSTFSDHGLVRLAADGSLSDYNSENSVLSHRVRTCAELSDGSLAVASVGGVYLMKDGEFYKSYTASEGLSAAETLSICPKKDGGMYLGRDGDGIYEIAADGTITHLTEADGLSSGVIMRIKYDERYDLYWVISSNSLCYIKDGKIVNVTNFPYFNNFDVFSDTKGMVWVLSGTGIYVVDAEDVIKNKNKMPYILYDTGVGLPCVTTANSRNDLTENGTLYISGSTGVCMVNINNAFQDEVAVRTAIPSIVADGKEIYADGKSEVVIPSDTKRLTINAYALSYALSDPEISYRLRGFDDAASQGNVSRLEQISYTNLTGGSYTFEFSVVDPLTGEHHNERTLRIIKQRSLTEQWWFVLLAILGIMLVTGWLVSRYQAHQLKKAEEKMQEEKDLRNQVISAFAKCIDYKDRYTKGHSFRVADYTRMIAKAMGKYSEEEIEDFYNIALLHDIGKISIPDAILNKPGRLSDEEFEIMKTHASNGAEILKEIRIMPELAEGALYHHERYNGRGYPTGVAGAGQVPEVAQIVAVADSFDAMYSTRVYRKKMNLEDVIAELERCSGEQYNPEIVDAFVKLLRSGEFEESHAGEANLTEQTESTL